MTPKLTIDLIPDTSFFKNVRSHTSQATWDKIRKKIFEQTNYYCQICGGQGKKHPVECHEEWEYNNGIQKLVNLIALCPSCHSVKHYGLAQIMGKEKAARKHLKKVNQWTDEQTDQHIRAAFEIWAERSLVKWQLDLTYLETL